MPSLIVTKTARENTFKHFYLSLIKQNSNFDNGLKQNFPAKILKMFTISIFVISCLFMATFGYSDIIFYHHYTTYQKYQLEYARKWMIDVVVVFLSLVCVIHVFMNGYYNYSLKHNIVVIFIVCILIHGTIMTFLLWQHDESNNPIWYFEYICNNILTGNLMFQYTCPNSFSIVNLYASFFGYPFCLFLTLTINHLIFLCCRNKIVTNKKFQHQKIVIVNNKPIKMNQFKDLHRPLINAQAFERHLQSESKDSTIDAGSKSTIATNATISTISTNTNNHNYNNYNNYNLNNYNYSYSSKKSKYSFCIYIVFGILILLFDAEIYVVTRILYFYTSHVDYYFYCLLFSTSVSKTLLKFVANRIDSINMNYTRKFEFISPKWYRYISMEIFIEFSIDLVYYGGYYYLFIYELSHETKNNISQVLVLIFLHISSEAIQSIMKFSSFYFNQTNKIYRKIEDYYNHNYLYNNVNMYNNTGNNNLNINNNNNNIKSKNSNNNGSINTANVKKNPNKHFGSFLSLILYIFEDVSDLDEWRIRHAIDLSIRGIALCCMICWYAIALNIIPPSFFQVSSKSDYYRAIFYLGLSCFCDLTYFLCLFLVRYYFTKHFDIWKPLILIYTANAKVFLFIVSSSILFAIFFAV